jgi:GxxExxY protein
MGVTETTEEMKKRINEVAERILKGAYAVSNALGVGFVEKVYENALAYELRKAGLRVEQQHPVTVYYDGVDVGRYTADLLVEELVIVELKAAKALGDVDMPSL